MKMRHPMRIRHSLQSCDTAKFSNVSARLILLCEITIELLYENLCSVSSNKGDSPSLNFSKVCYIVVLYATLHREMMFWEFVQCVKRLECFTISGKHMTVCGDKLCSKKIVYVWVHVYICTYIYIYIHMYHHLRQTYNGMWRQIM